MKYFLGKQSEWLSWCLFVGSVYFSWICSEFCTFGEDAGVELHCLGHVASDLHLSVHEGILGLEFAWEKLHEVVIKHDKGRVGLAFLGECDGTVSVFEIDSDNLGLVTLLFTELEMVDSADLCDDTSSLVSEEGLDFLEDLGGLKRHLYFLIILFVL